MGPLLFSFTALTSLLLLSYIARQLGQLVGKGLGWEVITEFLVLSIPFTFAMTVPMSILVSTLYAFSRLAAENEVTAFKANGISMWRLLTPVLVLGALFMAGMVLFNDQVLPRANHRLAQLQTDIVRTKPTFALKEQVINELQRERLYLRASRVFEGTSRLTDVTVYDLSDPTRRRTIYADSGLIAFAPNMKDLHMTLYDGVMQEVPTDDPARLTRLFYRIDRIRVPDVASQFTQSAQGSQSKSDREMTVCEMTQLATISERRMRHSMNEERLAEVELAREAGRTAPDAELLSPNPPPSLGAIYCSAVTWVAGLVSPTELEAAQAPAVAQAPVVTQAPADTQDPAVKPAPEVRRTPAFMRRSGARQEPMPQDPAAMQDPTAQPLPRTPLGGRARPDEMQQMQPEGGEAVSEPLPSVALTRRDEARMQAMSNRREANQYLVEIHKKFALAFACFVFVLVGAPVALRFPRGGVGLTLGVSFAIFGLYYVGLISGESLADRDLLAPNVAMWATNALMLVIGLVLAMRMGSETGSQRGGGGFAELVTRVQYAMSLRRER